MTLTSSVLLSVAFLAIGACAAGSVGYVLGRRRRSLLLKGGQIAAMRADVLQARRDRAEVETRLAADQGRLAKSREQVTRLQTELENRGGRARMLIREVERARRQQVADRKALEATQHDVRAARQARDNALRQLQQQTARPEPRQRPALGHAERQRYNERAARLESQRAVEEERRCEAQRRAERLAARVTELEQGLVAEREDHRRQTLRLREDNRLLSQAVKDHRDANQRAVALEQQLQHQAGELLRVRGEAAKASRQATQQHLEDARRELAARDQELTALRARLEQGDPDLTVMRSSADVDAAVQTERRLAELETERRDLADEAVALQGELAQRDAANAQLRRSLQRAAADSATLRQQMEQGAEQRRELDRLRKVQTEEVERRTAEIEELSRVRRTNEEISAKLEAAEAASAQSPDPSHQERLRQAEEEKRRLAEELARDQGKLADLEQRERAAAAQRTPLEAALQTTKQELLDLKRRLDEAEKQAAEAESSRAGAAEDELASMRQRLARQSGELEDTTQRLRQTELRQEQERRQWENAISRRVAGLRRRIADELVSAVRPESGEVGKLRRRLVARDSELVRLRRQLRRYRRLPELDPALSVAAVGDGTAAKIMSNLNELHEVRRAVVTDNLGVPLAPSTPDEGTDPLTSAGVAVLEMTEAVARVLPMPDIRSVVINDGSAHALCVQWAQQPAGADPKSDTTSPGAPAVHRRRLSGAPPVGSAHGTTDRARPHDDVAEQPGDGRCAQGLVLAAYLNHTPGADDPVLQRTLATLQDDTSPHHGETEEVQHGPG